MVAKWNGYKRLPTLGAATRTSCRQAGESGCCSAACRDRHRPTLPMLNMLRAVALAQAVCTSASHASARDDGEKKGAGIHAEHGWLEEGCPGSTCGELAAQQLHVAPSPPHTEHGWCYLPAPPLLARKEQTNGCSSPMPRPSQRPQRTHP